MAIAKVIANKTSASGLASVLTCSLDATGCDYLHILVHEGQNAGAVPTVITFATVQTPSLVIDSGNGPNNGARTLCYKLLAPTTGTNNLSVTRAVANDRWAISLVGYSGVNQTTPNGTAVSAVDEGSVATTPTITSAAGEVIADGVSCWADETKTLAAAGGQTEDVNGAVTGQSPRYGASHKNGSSSTTTSWTTDGVLDWAIVAVPLKPAAGGSAAIPGESILNHFTDGSLELGLSRVESQFKGKAGVITAGQRDYSPAVTFGEVKDELGILRVQSQFKGLLGTTPTNLAGQRLYTPANIPQPVEEFDFFGNSVVIGAAGPGTTPTATLGHNIEVITNPLFTDQQFDFSTAVVKVGKNLGILPGFPRETFQSPGLLASMIQVDDNNYQIFFGLTRGHPAGGGDGPLPPPPTLIPDAGFVGVGLPFS